MTPTELPAHRRRCRRSRAPARLQEQLPDPQLPGGPPPAGADARPPRELRGRRDVAEHFYRSTRKITFFMRFSGVGKYVSRAPAPRARPVHKKADRDFNRRSSLRSSVFPVRAVTSGRALGSRDRQPVTAVTETLLRAERLHGRRRHRSPAEGALVPPPTVRLWTVHLSPFEMLILYCPQPLDTFAIKHLFVNQVDNILRPPTLVTRAEPERRREHVPRPVTAARSRRDSVARPQRSFARPRLPEARRARARLRSAHRLGFAGGARDDSAARRRRLSAGLDDAGPESGRARYDY
ncbi:hypothetical protein EVAR_47353_1 [Eumeta japonica]|uniref:Uncharacterized protein n=1 Tax=Eumeta variegata TaxID=151549 RepID=A0A4C1WWP7_EUMVA|nr:hypothetical protein EVAR_47353_1 [Eumeta japonica]